MTLYYTSTFTPAIWSTIAWTEKFNNGLCIHFLRLRRLKSSCNSSRIKNRRCELTDYEIHKRLSGVTFWYAPISSTHEGHVQMEYLFVYVPRLSDTSFSICCATGGVYRNGASVYICTCGVVGISCKWECYTGTFYFGKHKLIFKTDENVSFHKRLESPELLVYFYAPDESISGKFLFFSSFSSAATCYWINCHGNHTISDRWFLGSRCFLSEGTEWKVS